MRTKLGAGIMAGLLAALAYGMVMQLVTSPAMVEGQTAMTSGETRSMEEVGPLVDGGRKPLILMVARMVGAESLGVAWSLVMIAGMAMGILFGVSLGDRVQALAPGVTWGVAYAVFWWIAATLIFMPLLLGMSAFSPIREPAMRAGAFVGLAAYVLAGFILGTAFLLLRRNAPTNSRAIR